MKGEGEGAAAPHVMVVAYPAQGHINPMFRFARRLLATNTNTSSNFNLHVTFVTSDDAKERMSKANKGDHGGGMGKGMAMETFSDGLPPDYVFSWSNTDFSFVDECIRREGARTLRQLMERLNRQGPPVTCVVYDSFLDWVPPVVAAFGVPTAYFWTQSCAVLLLYLHAFRLGIASHNLATQAQPLLDAFNTSPQQQQQQGSQGATGLELEVKDLPSFLQPDNSLATLLDSILRQFPLSDNIRWFMGTSVAELESDDIARLHALLPSRFLTVGPLLQPHGSGGAEAEEAVHMWKAADCTSWLDSMRARSVVYVSFGSLRLLCKEQIRELALALRDCGQPFLWVLRPTTKDNNKDKVAEEEEEEEEERGFPEGFVAETQGRGMVVQWAPQMQVLLHKAVGVFVSHCGWNSTLEAVSAGVPMLCFPHWSDQTSNAAIISKLWKTGLLLSSGSGSNLPSQSQSELQSQGVVAAEEVQRCLDIVLHSDQGAAIRRNASHIRLAASAAAAAGGSSHCNIQTFLSDVVACASSSAAIH